MAFSKLDLAFCLLKATRCKKNVKLCSVKVEYHEETRILQFRKQHFSPGELLTFLFEVLADPREYRKALSLKLYSMPIIKEIIELSPKDCIRALCSIKCGRPDKGTDCCLLHKRIGARIPKKVFLYLNDMENLKELATMLEFYGRCIEDKQGRVLFLALCQGGFMSKRIIDLLWEPEFFRGYVYVGDVLQLLQKTPELFARVYLKTTASKCPELEGFPELKIIWRWLINACLNWSEVSWLKETINKNKADSEEELREAYRTYLKSVLRLPKSYWLRLIKNLPKPFSVKEDILDVFYASEEAKPILRHLLKLGILPYPGFSSQQLLYAIKNGLFRKYKFTATGNSKAIGRQIDMAHKMMEAIERDNDLLDQQLDASIYKVLLPRLLEDCEKHRKMLGCFAGLRVEYLSMEQWRKICFDCRHLNAVFHNRSFAEAEILFKGLELSQDTSKEAIEMCRKVFTWVEQPNVEPLFRQVFNPYLSTEYRSYLLTHGRFHMKYYITLNDADFLLPEGDNTLPPNLNDAKKRLADTIKSESHRWRCLLEEPPGELLQSQLFWMYIIGSDFMDDICEKERLEFCQKMGKTEGREGLFLLNFIMNTFFDCITAYSFEGDGLKFASVEFWSNIFPIQ